MSTAWLGAAIELALPYKLYPCCRRNYGLMVSLWIPHGPDPLVGNNENKSAPSLHINLNCARGYTQKKPPACTWKHEHASASPSHPSLSPHVSHAGADKSITCLSQCVPACLHNVCRLMCKISNHVPDFYSFIFIIFLFILPPLCTL